MSGDIPERVTCEVCGTAFDPTESRGWCPNKACGRWQHPAFPLSDGAAAAEADGGVDAPTKVCPSCGKDVRADANFCKFCSHEFEDEPQDDAGAADDEPGLDQCPDCGADLSSIPPDRLDDCPICGTNLAEVIAERTEPSVTPADLSDCPACGEDLTDIPADMRMVCPGCRVDLREAIAEHGVGGDGEPAKAGQATGGQAAGSGAGAQTAGATGGQPDDATQNVDTLKGIGSSYAERLADAGVETVGDLVASDTAQLAAATDISEKRLDEWKERAPVDAADVGGATAGGQAAGGQQDGPAAGQQGQANAGAGGQQGAQGAGTGSSGQAAGGQRGGQQGTQSTGGQQAGQRGGQQGGQRTGSQSGRSGGQRTGGQQSGRGTGGGGQGRGGARGGANAGGQAGAGGQGRAGAGGGQAGGAGTGGQGGAGYGRSGRGAQPNYDTVVFEVMGQDIRANPGDAIGREIRTAMVEGGAPDNDAVYVHREHVRVEQEGDTFYLVQLGQNSVKINGEPVGQHDRLPVESGDTVSFSEVVTADVRLE